MRIQLVIDGATTEQVRDLTLAFGRVKRSVAANGGTLPSFSRADPTVGIDGIAMRWTSPPLSRDQAEEFFGELAHIEEPLLEAKVNERDNAPLAEWEKELMLGGEATAWPETGHLSISDCIGWTDGWSNCYGRVALQRNHLTGGIDTICEYHFNH